MNSDKSNGMLLGLRTTGLGNAVALGVDKNGQFHFATTITKPEDALFMLECARTHLLNLIDGGTYELSNAPDDDDGIDLDLGLQGTEAPAISH